jgi:hypothetical protein
MKRRIKTLDLILALIGAILLVYTTVVLILFAQTGQEPSALTYSLFGALTGEAGFCGWIKQAKLKQQNEAKPPGAAPAYTPDELDKGGGA